MTNRMSDILRQMGRPVGTAFGVGTGRLDPLADFGSNPGDLAAHVYLPPNRPDFAPLVVVLHGCTQTAEGYDHGSGWSQLADLGGFALLFPEQRRENNPNLCFNWFVPDDIRRGSGEAASIRQMVDAMVDRHAIDRDRIFVTGLSAGGAMAAVMLATYPEVFAGGAVIAGLPYACAANVPQALKRMRGEGLPDPASLAERLRGAAGHAGPWPTLSVWHGTADATVSPANAEATLAQWRLVQNLRERPDHVEDEAGYSRRVWRAPDGRDVLEFFEIAGMAHGTPLKTSGRDGCGAAGPFMLDVGVSSTRLIARSWGLLTASAPVEAETAVPPRRTAAPSRTMAQTPWHTDREAAGEPARAPGGAGDIGNVIENALRQAGLLR